METAEEREGTAKRKKSGRPQKANKKSRYLMVRLTPAELMLIQARAGDAGLKPSEWFRQAARQAQIVPRLSPEDMSILRALSGLANNLNQLTKLAHQQGLITLTLVIRKSLEETNVLMEKLIDHDW